jgi:phage gp29-like protein
MSDQPLTREQLTSISFMTEDGAQYQPVDTMLGGLWRQMLQGDPNSRVATLETMYDFWINNVPDPDEAIAKDPLLLSRIYMHPDVVSANETRVLTVSGFPEEISPPDNTDNPQIAEVICNYVKEVWENFPNHRQFFASLQAAVLEGGTGMELIWVKDNDGFERPVNWYQISKTRFLFDRLGNMSLLTRNNPIWGAYIALAPSPDNIKRFPAGKFIYHVHKRRPGRWNQPQLEGYQYFGIGEDVALYYPVTFDFYVTRQRMRWLEKYGDPPTDVYYPELATVTPQVIAQAVSSCRGESVSVWPRPVGTGRENDFWTVTQRDVPTMSNDAFEKFQQGYVARKVDKILLGSAEATERDQPGGYSSEVARQSAGPEIRYLWDAHNISNTINQQLIAPIVLRRFPGCPAHYMPKHKMSPHEERDRLQEAQILQTVTTMVPVPESEIYEKTGIRPPLPGEPTVDMSQPMGMPGDPFDQPPPDDTDTKDGSNKGKGRGAIGQKAGAGGNGALAGKARAK